MTERKRGKGKGKERKESKVVSNKKDRDRGRKRGREGWKELTSFIKNFKANVQTIELKFRTNTVRDRHTGIHSMNSKFELKRVSILLVVLLRESVTSLTNKQMTQVRDRLPFVSFDKR